MPNIALIILAAGGSTRLSRPKQLLPYKGATLLRHAAQTALVSSCRPVLVVLGANGEACRAEIGDLPVEIVKNKHWEDGMGTSIAAGLSALEKANSAPDAAIFMLCDQPGLTSTHLDRLAEAFLAGAQIAASEYEGSAGVPALFARSYYPELIALDPAQGAKPVIAKYAASVATVPFPEGSVDIDTPADYEGLDKD